MSKAFTREDVDPPERSGRVRSASGLPPGAANYLTARGAQRLRLERAKLAESALDKERMAELDRIFASATVVDSTGADPESVAFGAVVTVEDLEGKKETYRIVGVDELDFEPDSVSWISPIGKTLLAAELGDRVTLGNGNKSRTARIVKIEYPTA
jgi:transcription elongation GreA/GreB family factor